MRILLWGVTAGALAVLVSFLLFEEYSPLYQKFYPKPVPLSYGWAQAHAHFYLVLVLLNPSEAVGHIIVYVFSGFLSERVLAILQNADNPRAGFADDQFRIINNRGDICRCDSLLFGRARRGVGVFGGDGVVGGDAGGDEADGAGAELVRGVDRFLPVLS